jgi:hypothetical protein
MQQSHSSVPPPEYTQQDPTSSTPSSLQDPTSSTTHSHTTTTSAPTSTATLQQQQRSSSPTPSTQTTTSTILPSYADTGSYKGYPSEQAYLTALTEWAETKKYVQPSEQGQTLSGFFGYKTMDDYTEESRLKNAEQTRKRRKSSIKGQEGGERHDEKGVMGFFRKMARKDEGGGAS